MQILCFNRKFEYIVYHKCIHTLLCLAITWLSYSITTTKSRFFFFICSVLLHVIVLKDVEFNGFFVSNTLDLCHFVLLVAPDIGAIFFFFFSKGFKKKIFSVMLSSILCHSNSSIRACEAARGYSRSLPMWVRRWLDS